MHVGSASLQLPDSCLRCSREDSRDERPLLYPGRFMMAASTTGEGAKFWRTSQLVDAEVAQAGPHLAPRDMVMIENLDTSALPETIVNDSHARGAAKACQIGVTAAQATLEGLLVSRL